MSQSTKRSVRFETAAGVPLEAAFDAGRLTSDGGLPWLAEADAEGFLIELRLAERPADRQADPGAAEHVGENLLAAHRSHVYQRLVLSGTRHDRVTLVYGALALLGAIGAVTLVKSQTAGTLVVCATMAAASVLAAAVGASAVPAKAAPMPSAAAVCDNERELGASPSAERSSSSANSSA